jgi:glycosyltransferase involved in cell wall biosynthesis
VISVSEFEKRRLTEAGVASTKIVTIHNGINSTRFKTEPDVTTKQLLAVTSDTPIIGICAGLRPEKNHEIFLYAAREVANRKDVYFLIVGDGERRKGLEALAAELGIAKRCFFAGFVKEKIAEMLSLFDIGVLCSELEAMPVTLLEYMASSKPIVATQVGGIPEVVQDGVNGFLVPPKDPHALAQKLLLLLTNPDMAKKMGKDGLGIVKQKFSEEVMIKKVEDLYTQALTPLLKDPSSYSRR